MKVRYTAGAIDDLAGIADYLEERNPSAAAKVGAEIRATVRIVGKHPYSGRAQDVANVRKVVTGRYGYLIFYAVDKAQNMVDILGVQHPSREREFADS